MRAPAKLRENLALLGVDPNDARIDVVAGDMTDAAAAREASSGCDQAIHAAATFSYRRRDAERMRRENKVGTTTVLDAAIEAGCTGIVHVSSTAALLRPGATLDHESPLGVALGPYTQSKVESERVARDRQELGSPSPSSTRAASSGRTIRTSARATRSSVRSCAAGSPPGHGAGRSGWTSGTPPTWWWPHWTDPDGATSSPARRSPSRTRHFEP